MLKESSAGVQFPEFVFIVCPFYAYLKIYFDSKYDVTCFGLSWLSKDDQDQNKLLLLSRGVFTTLSNNLSWNVLGKIDNGF